MFDDRKAHVDSDQPDESEIRDISSNDSSGFVQQSTLSDQEMNDCFSQSDPRVYKVKQTGII